MKYKKTFIIAEIGINHDGNYEKAKKLIAEAKKSGADAVKFQYFKAEDLYLKSNHTYKVLKKLELSKKKFISLRKFSKKLNIPFFCTPFSLEGIEFLKEIKVDGFKIASMDNTNFTFIDNCLKKSKNVLVSTGMLNKKETDNLIKKYKNKVYFMHCVSSYPVKKEDLGLEVLNYYNQKLKNKTFGYSDHFVGMDSVKIALCRGAKIIEKHFTLKKRSYLDHALSMDKNDLKNLDDFRKILLKEGSANIFFKSRKDLQNKFNFRRGLYANKKIKPGEKFKLSNISYVRPLNKSKFLDIKQVIGKKSKFFFKKDQCINNKVR